MKNSGRGLDRRDVMSGALLGASAVGLGMAGSYVAAQASELNSNDAAELNSDGDIVKVLDNWPIAETVTGKVRGYQKSGIFVFKGIPYAATTVGAGRFMPPKPVSPWQGVRSSLQFGPVSPQEFRTEWFQDEAGFLFNWNDGHQGEDCLCLNVWTPALADNKKRPVMVWCHGGGFQNGNGQEQPAYDGENLSRRGDVVVISHNHRLNAVGFLNLSKYGEKYKYSGNVGMLDIVAVLEWVRDNAASFGGDPGNVTIMGQSGGGSKVSTLMAMPRAKGLFHKATIDSGSRLKASSAERSAALADAVLQKLGISASNIDDIQTVPVDSLVAAGLAAMAATNDRTGGFINGKAVERTGFGPYVDGSVLPRDPFYPDATPLSAEVPLMVGTVLNEQAHGRNHPEYPAMGDEQARAMVVKNYGDHGVAIYAAYRSTYPQATPFEVWSRASAAGARVNAIKQASLKSRQSAPVYLWWFTWQTALFNGRQGAFHCSELPFVFHNTDVSITSTGGGKRARDLADRVCDAWIHFARSGNPNHPGLPKWAPFTEKLQTTMIFDDVCTAQLTPDLKAIESIMKES